MFRTIVVGYDGPERGGEAIALAEVLRDPRHRSLLLTSAYLPVPVATAPLVVAPADLRDPTDASLAEARAQLEGRVPVRTISVPAAPARALTETAEREHADLVVVGSSRHGPVGRVLPVVITPRAAVVAHRRVTPPAEAASA